MSEEQKMETGQKTSQKDNLVEKSTVPKAKKTGQIKWIIVTAVTVAAAVIAGVLFYVNSPSYQASKALELGERYIDELKYEQAIVEFLKALELDPDNTEIAAAVSAHLEEFLTIAENSGHLGDYNTERQFAAFVLMLDNENEKAAELTKDADIRKQAAKGDEAFEKGDYKAAKGIYEGVILNGGKEEYVTPRLLMCNVFLKLLELCEAGDWPSLAEYMDSRDFIAIEELLKDAPQFVSGTVKLMVGESNGNYYVVTGDLTADNASGTGVGVVSCVNTYAVYSGGWGNYLPDGDGSLTVWNKNEDMGLGNVYIGEFSGGIITGTAVLRVKISREDTDIDIAVKEGLVSAFEVDEDGNVWLCDVVDNGTYVADGMSVENGSIAGYVAGVPGFGGSDQKLLVQFMLIDKEPPVLSCSLRLGWHEGRVSIGRGITAIDNVDGDITSSIKSKSTKTKSSRGQQDQWEYGLVVEYSATDAAGNTGGLIVTYDCKLFCGDEFQVVSIINK